MSTKLTATLLALVPYFILRGPVNRIARQFISEGTGVSRQGLGWPNAPGLWTDAQTEAWKPVTEAVHRAGGKIVALGTNINCK